MFKLQGLVMGHTGLRRTNTIKIAINPDGSFRITLYLRGGSVTPSPGEGNASTF